MENNARAASARAASARAASALPCTLPVQLLLHEVVHKVVRESLAVAQKASDKQQRPSKERHGQNMVVMVADVVVVVA